MLLEGSSREQDGRVVEQCARAIATAWRWPPERIRRARRRASRSPCGWALANSCTPGQLGGGEDRAVVGEGRAHRDVVLEAAVEQG